MLDVFLRPRRLRLLASLLTAGSLLCFRAWAAETNAPAAKAFRDEPEAHKLYSQMVDTMRKATTLSWVSDYRWEARGETLGHATYRIWLKKPNYARMEATAVGHPERSGILVGDGDYFWTYWPKEKPRYGWEIQRQIRRGIREIPPHLLHERADPGRAAFHFPLSRQIGGWHRHDDPRSQHLSRLHGFASALP